MLPLIPIAAVALAVISGDGTGGSSRPSKKMTMAQFKHLAKDLSKDDLFLLLKRNIDPPFPSHIDPIRELRKAAIAALQAGRLTTEMVCEAAGTSNGFMYGVLITPGPLMAIRYPTPLPVPWGTMLKALTPVMALHGMKQKDIFAIDGLLPGLALRTSDEEAEARRFDTGFTTGASTVLQKFRLYDWRDGHFALVRESDPLS